MFRSVVADSVQGSNLCQEKPERTEQNRVPQPGRGKVVCRTWQGGLQYLADLLEQLHTQFTATTKTLSLTVLWTHVSWPPPRHQQVTVKLDNGHHVVDGAAGERAERCPASRRVEVGQEGSIPGCTSTARGYGHLTTLTTFPGWALLDNKSCFTQLTYRCGPVQLGLTRSSGERQNHYWGLHY